MSPLYLYAESLMHWSTFRIMALIEYVQVSLDKTAFSHYTTRHCLSQPCPSICESNHQTSTNSEILRCVYYCMQTLLYDCKVLIIACKPKLTP